MYRSAAEFCASVYRGFESIDDFEKEITETEEQDMINDTDITQAIGQSRLEDLLDAEQDLLTAIARLAHAEPEDSAEWNDALLYLESARLDHFDAQAMRMAWQLDSDELRFRDGQKNTIRGRELLSALKTLVAALEASA